MFTQSDNCVLTHIRLNLKNMLRADLHTIHTQNGVEAFETVSDNTIIFHGRTDKCNAAMALRDKIVCSKLPTLKIVNSDI